MSNWTILGPARNETLGDVDEGVVLDNGGYGAHAIGPWWSLGTTAFPWQGLVLSGRGAAGRYMIDLGIGGSGSQVVIVDSFFVEIAAVPSNFAFFVPVRVPGGVELWARMRASASSAFGVQVNAHGFASGALTPFPAGCRLVECLNPQTADTTPNTTITQSGNTANESSWAQVVSSTSNRYGALWATLSIEGDTSRTASDMAIDIGIGGSGSEQTLISNVSAYQEGDRIIACAVFGPFFCDIPAGTRVAVRARCDTSAADSLGVAVMGAVP